MKDRIICKRLHRGDDLMLAIKEIAKEEKIEAAVVLSAVGCVSQLTVRDASGVTIQQVHQDCEILSLQGTVSEDRCHLHISCSKEDLSAIGGHLVAGTIINTTCELVLLKLEGWKYKVEQDDQTGYDEIVFQHMM